MSVILKQCRKCGLEKSEEEFPFYRHRIYKGIKRETICKLCRRSTDKLWKQNNKERNHAYNKKWRLTKPEKSIISAKRRALKWNYGISLEQNQEILKKQNGTCAICFCGESSAVHGKVRGLAVDHHHETKKIRGLLCQKCNQALGLLGENISTMESMILYLKAHG